MSIEYSEARALTKQYEEALRDHVVAAQERLRAEKGYAPDPFALASSVAREQQEANQRLFALAMSGSNLEAAMRQDIKHFTTTAANTRAKMEQEKAA